MDAMALPSREIAVVGDRIREEIALGNRMGMRTVWYRAGKFADELPEGEDQEPWATVTSLDDVWVRLQAAE
jgi:FMN phosphatase YigB (HAD superfamily)